jgi:hypothetical protein
MSYYFAAPETAVKRKVYEMETTLFLSRLFRVISPDTDPRGYECLLYLSMAFLILFCLFIFAMLFLLLHKICI